MGAEAWGGWGLAGAVAWRRDPVERQLCVSEWFSAAQTCPAVLFVVLILSLAFN